MNNSHQHKVPSSSAHQCLRISAFALPLALVVCCYKNMPSYQKPSSASRTTIVFSTKNGPITITAEIADTHASRAQGLMGRTKLENNACMIFVFPQEKKNTFWMKNTLIALDMVFVNDQHKIVGILHRVEPLSHSPREIQHPSQYVIELNAGYAADMGIQVGDRLTMQPLPVAHE